METYVQLVPPLYLAAAGDHRGTHTESRQELGGEMSGGYGGECPDFSGRGTLLQVLK